ncbi:hypothetical protein ACTFIW_005876 [Dictyostelium discoideum]
MIIFKNNEIRFNSNLKSILFLLLLLSLFINGNNCKTAQQFLDENFNHALFREHQLEKEYLTKQLVKDEPNMYSDWTEAPAATAEAVTIMRGDDYYFDYDKEQKIEMIVFGSENAISSGSLTFKKLFKFWYGCKPTWRAEANFNNNNTPTTTCPNDCHSYWGQKFQRLMWWILSLLKFENNPSPRSCVCPPGQAGLE